MEEIPKIFFVSSQKFREYTCNSELIGGLISRLIIRKVIFAHEDQSQDDMMKTISNISVKITDWESGVEYGSVLFDGQSNSDDCYHHLIHKVSWYS